MKVWVEIRITGVWEMFVIFPDGRMLGSPVKCFEMGSTFDDIVQRYERVRR